MAPIPTRAPFERVFALLWSLELMWMDWVIVCWSLEMSSPVAVPKGTSQIASFGLRRRGLVQMPFWSRSMRFGVPARVMSSGLGPGLVTGRGEGGAFCGSGASGSRLELESGAAFCARAEGWSRRDAAKKSGSNSLFGVTSIGERFEVALHFFAKDATPRRRLP
jgi:hypothetical protein